MAYPQPDSDKYVLQQDEFFRLNTPLVSDGDIYESAQGSNGLAIGPDSDISKVNIGYFDGQVPGNLNQVSISPSRPFSGLLIARNQEVFMPSKVPGRILIWPDEIFNPNYLPSDFDPGTSRVDFIVPVLDVIEYFEPTQLSPQRNDKVYQFQLLPWGAGAGGDLYYIVIPFYGRKYASIVFGNNTNVDIHVSVIGVTYEFGSSSTSALEILLDGPTNVVAANGAYSHSIKATTDRMHHALAIKLDPVAAPNAGKTPLRIVVSDTEP